MQRPADSTVAAGAGVTAQRFIPFRRSDLISMLDGAGRLEQPDQEGFPALAALLKAVFHHDLHERLEMLKDAYAPFDPDPDTRRVHTHDDVDRASARERLFAGLWELLDDGNFEQIDEHELRRSFEEESLLKLRLEVDDADLEQALFFRRGETVREEETSTWFGLRRKTVRFTNYEKVLVLVSFKDAEHLQGDPEDLPFEPGSTILKLFQDVPRADLEMLYPNAVPRMRVFDKLLIGVPAAVGAIAVFSTQLITTLGLLFLVAGFYLGITDRQVELDQATLVALGAALGSLGGYLNRQFNKYKKRKMEFMKTLADSLYFRNLDNDAGVLHHLNDDAEEEEVKEALLAWYFLRASEQPLRQGELDRSIEGWFRDRWDLQLDFEVEDGVDKLRRLRLVTEAGDGRLQAVPAAEALRRLDERWDAYFRYDRAASDRSR